VNFVVTAGDGFFGAKVAGRSGSSISNFAAARRETTTHITAMANAIAGPERHRMGVGTTMLVIMLAAGLRCNQSNTTALRQGPLPLC